MPEQNASPCQVSTKAKSKHSKNRVLKYQSNQQYSITAITDGSGSISERYAYSAYGTPTITDASGTARTTTAIGNRYTYTGREWDEALALYHYRARMYDSVAGRFVSRDPISYSDGNNLFGIYIGLALLDHTGTSVERGKTSRTGFKVELLDKAEQLAHFNNKLGRFAPIKLSNSFRGFCDVTACDEKCDCEVTKSLTKAKCHLGGEIGVESKGVPLGTVPAKLSIFGSIRYTVNKEDEVGGCNDMNHSKICFSYTGSIGVKLFAKTPDESIYKGCIGARITCDNSWCIDPPNDSGFRGNCSVTVNAEGCVGWWCTQVKLLESEPFGVW